MKRANLREKNKEDKLLRIKSAAFDLFLSKGFDDSTTREIAERAGVGMGTVFVYAETKRDLLFLIVNDGLERCIEETRERISAEHSLLTNILIILQRHYLYFAENPVLSRAALREMYFYQSGKQAERFNQTRQSLRHMLMDLIDEALKAKIISSAEPAEIIAQVIFAIYQVDLRIWLSDAELDLQRGSDRLRRQIEVVLNGLAPKPAALKINAGALD